MRRTWTSKDKFTYVKAIHRNNYSLTKALRLKPSNINPFPIKPTQNIIPKDLNLQLIFTNMMKSSEELSKTYSPSIINNINSNSNFNSNINNISRKTFLEKIRDFFLFFNIDYKIFFKAILLYDIITLENNEKKLLSSIEEIALGALILSIKFNYDENKMFSMKKFLQFYGEQTYSLSEIIDIERKALMTINYYLNFTTPMCFLEFFLINGIIYNTDGLKDNEYSKIYLEIEKVLENLMEESNSYLKYNFFYLACSVVSFCRENYNLEKWPKTLKKVFSIDFYYFQNEYKIFFEKMEKSNNNINRIYENKTYNSNTYNIKKDISFKNNNIVLLDSENSDLDSNKNNPNDNVNNKNINNINNNFNYFDKYKKNYFKTIDGYNNIINININNVSFNNIYNNNIKNELDEQDINNSTSISNRSHYKPNVNKVYNNLKKNCILKYKIYLKNNSKKKEKKYENNDKNGIEYNNIYNLEQSLPEIKEVKETKETTEQNNYYSPPKVKQKHYYIFKRENKFIYNKDKIEEKEENENKENKNDNIIIENITNNNQSNHNIENSDNINNSIVERKREEIISRYTEELKEKNRKKYKRNNLTYNPKIISKNNIISFDDEENNNINNNNDDNKKESNNINEKKDIYNTKNENIIYSTSQDDKIEINDKKIIPNNNIDINERNINNEKINNNVIINNEQTIKEKYDNNKYNIYVRLANDKINDNSKNKETFTAKKPYNLLISKYLNYNNHYMDTKNFSNKSNRHIKYNINNIKPVNLENKNKERKKDYISINNYEIPNNKVEYRRFKEINIFQNNNDININNNETTDKNDIRNNEMRSLEKDKNKVIRKHRGGNKVKYNNLIKHKLSKCESINKRKNIRNNYE